ncbi:MAG: CoA transferase [Rhodanobacteraceae bacterium]|nr:CoA transferase [Rhodanobacteraceae bacterium]
MTANHGRSGALDGLLVVDLTQVLAGPYATMLLADQGARVIKIEPPTGDLARTIGPYPKGAVDVDRIGYGAYFASINRGKESLILDLKRESAKEVFFRLVEKADVLIENFRAGVMESLGLGYETLAARNPKLVYAAIRGFGDQRSGASPYVDWPAYDPVAQAMGGIMGITGNTRGGPPTKVGPGVGDIAPALFLSFGIAAACWQAQRSGRGQFVDVAMVDAVLALCERIIFQYDTTGVAPTVEGSGHPMLCPFGIFPAADGFVALGVPHDRFWKQLVDRMDMPGLSTDPRFGTNVARVRNKDHVERLVSEWTAARTKKQIGSLLGGVVPFGPVFGADDIFSDPHFRAREMLVTIDYPGATAPLTIANSPIRMSATPGGVRGRAPLSGEHTDKILDELGFDLVQREHLRNAGVVL